MLVDIDIIGNFYFFRCLRPRRPRTRIWHAAGWQVMVSVSTEICPQCPIKLWPPPTNTPCHPPLPPPPAAKKKKKNAPTEGQDTYILGIHVGYPKKLLQYGSVNYVLEKWFYAVSTCFTQGVPGSPPRSVACPSQALSCERQWSCTCSTGSLSCAFLNITSMGVLPGSNCLCYLSLHLLFNAAELQYSCVGSCTDVDVQV